MAKNITEEINALLDQGKTSGQIIKLGYEKGTVDSVQRKRRDRKTAGQSPTKDRAATPTLAPSVGDAPDTSLDRQSELLEKTQDAGGLRRTGLEKENELLTVIGLPEKDRELIKARMEEVWALLRDNKKVKLTELDRALIEKAAKFALASTLEIDISPEEIAGETRLWEDLEMDSLAFLEMFDEFQGVMGLDIDVNVVAKYAVSHPVETFDDFLNQMCDFIERREEILKELGIGVDMSQLV